MEKVEPARDMYASLEVVDELDFLDLAEASGWGDGLPLIVPTRQRVDEMLSYCSCAPDESLGAVPPYGGEGTFAG